MKGGKRAVSSAAAQARATQAELTQAFALLKAGRLAEAESAYSGLIARHPRLAVAHNHLGLIAKAQGRLDRAEELLRRAVEFDPADPSGHTNLGNLLAKLGRYAEADESYTRVLERMPDSEDALLNRGWARYNLGDGAGALAAYRKAAARHPKSARAHNGCGMALALLGQAAEAEQSYRHAIVCDPRFAPALNNLGVLLRGQGRYDEACEAYRHALAIDPGSIEAHNNLGCALLDMNRLDEAKANLRKAVELLPTYADAIGNLGNAHLVALELDRAIETYARASALDPRKPEYRLHAAFARLTRGEFGPGWRGYEARLELPELAARLAPIKLPRWDGGALVGGTLLVVHEQGFGDTLQFLRFVGPALARAGRIRLVVPPSIRRLVADRPGLEIEEEGASLAGCTAWAPLLSLPLLLGNAGETLGETVPYLTVPADAEARWRARVGSEGFRVGLVWAGGPGRQLKDRQRSIPPELLEPLMRVPGVRFFSLQKTHADGALETLRAMARIEDFSADLADFAETAAAARAMDLVVSIDTSVLHLAGALGVQAWAMLIYSPDWRWLLGRADSPWYPSLTLFRQASPGDWHPVVDTVANALAARVGASSRQPAMGPAAA